MKYISLLFTFVFLFFALVQFNDPDPWIWIPVYLFSAYTSFSSFKDYYNPLLLMILVVGYGLGAIFLFPETSIHDWLYQEEQAKSLEMKMPFIEEARESMGLAICTLVNLVFLTIGFRRAKLPGYNIRFSNNSEGGPKKSAS